jgi:hypothetical protein
MGLIKCRDCAREISTKATACPQCGAKPSSGISTRTILLVGGLAIWWYSATRPSDPTPTLLAKTSQEIAAEKVAAAKDDAAFQQTVRVALFAKAALRDPASLTWESIRANDDASVVCLEYRARNGFGGMNREFTVYAEGGHMSQDAKLWNKHCRVPLKDMKHVQFAVK